MWFEAQLWLYLNDLECTRYVLYTLYTLSTYLANRRIKREQQSNVESAGHWCRILIWPPDCHLRPATTHFPATLALRIWHGGSTTRPIEPWIYDISKLNRSVKTATKRCSLKPPQGRGIHLKHSQNIYIFLSISQVFNVFRLRDLQFERVLFCFAIFRAVQSVQSNLRGKWKVGVETSSVYRERERCSRIAMHGTWKWRRMYKNPKYTCYIL